MKPTRKLTLRTLKLSIFIYSVCLLLFAFLLQWQWHLDPCPLCILERMVLLLVILTQGVNLIHNPEKIGQKIYLSFSLVFSTLGLLLGARHLWLIYVAPKTVSGCSPQLYYLLKTIPFQEVLTMLLNGTGECTDPYILLGLSLPNWTFLSFLLLVIAQIYVFFKS